MLRSHLDIIIFKQVNDEIVHLLEDDDVEDDKQCHPWCARCYVSCLQHHVPHQAGEAATQLCLLLDAAHHCSNPHLWLGVSPVIQPALDILQEDGLGDDCVVVWEDGSLDRKVEGGLDGAQRVQDFIQDVPALAHPIPTCAHAGEGGHTVQVSIPQGG